MWHFKAWNYPFKLKVKSRSTIIYWRRRIIKSFRCESARVSGYNGLFWNPWWFYQVIWSRFHGTRPDKTLYKAKMESSFRGFCRFVAAGNSCQKIPRNWRNLKNKFLKTKTLTSTFGPINSFIEDIHGFVLRYQDRKLDQKYRNASKISNGVLIPEAA